MKKKSRMIVIAAGLYLFGCSLFSWLKPADAFSDAERRALKQFPELSLQTVLNGSFMRNFEQYTLDQFPQRDLFRCIKATVAGSVFGQGDVNQLYMEDGYMVSMEYPMNLDSVGYAADRFRNVYEMFLKDSETTVYFSIIPDKNYFLAEKSGHLSMDYDIFIEEMVKSVPYMKYIDITDSLTIEDYYKTDSHWDQIHLLDAAAALLTGMDSDANREAADGMGSETGGKADRETFNSKESIYKTVTLEQPFYGVYYGQMARRADGDKLSYVTNEILDACVVYDHQNNKEIPMYDLDKAEGKDPYELFLGGSLSLVTIENPNDLTEKELVIFRDSFGSSIAPLLAEGYAKITLVDIRYIFPSMLERYISFENQDVLFLYSTSVLNNSDTIK